MASRGPTLEVRVPLVDVVLLREVARLVPAGHPPAKSALARCSRKPQPAAILTRFKKGCSVPVRELLDGEGHSKGRGVRGWARAVYQDFADN